MACDKVTEFCDRTPEFCETFTILKMQILDY